MSAIFQTTFSNAFSWMQMYEFRLTISPKFVPEGPINNIPALVQIMTWCRQGDRPLSEPMLVRLSTHGCVTRPQWGKIDCVIVWNHIQASVMLMETYPLNEYILNQILYPKFNIAQFYYMCICCKWEYNTSQVEQWIIGQCQWLCLHCSKCISRLESISKDYLELLRNQSATCALQWRHNEHDSVSSHQPHDCLLNRLFGRRSKKTSKLRVTGLCVGNSPGSCEFPAQRASNAENVSIWWRHHG